MFFMPFEVSAQVFGGASSSGDNIFEQAPAIQPETPQEAPASARTPEQPKSPIEQKVQVQGGLGNVQIKRVMPASSVATGATNTSKDDDDDDDEYIIIYMRNFKVGKTLSGFTNCSMRFFVMSTLRTPISNVSFRLKWPNMETPLSFDNVEPNVALYQDYALLGNGCYQMDKAPNVIVNRCRVKDMTQQACASKIHWAQ